jgi:opacity protein-like surface antigen
MMRKFCRSGIPFALAIFGYAGVAQADENLWVYARGSDTRPQGTWELKAQDIIKTGKEGGDYTAHEIRGGVEYGVTDRLTVGAEILVFNHDYAVTDPDLQPYFDTQGGAGGSFSETNIGGYEFGFKYNILSPYKDVVGLSVGAALDHRDYYRLDGAEINQDATELYAFIQKNFLDDTLIFALTPKMELEKRTSGSGADFVLEEEIAFDVAAGVSYRFAPGWFAGLEYRHQSDYLVPQVIGPDGGLVYDEPDLKPSDIDLFFPSVGEQFQNGNYFGPTLHYGAEKWWVTVGALFQFEGGGREGSFNRDGKNFDEHEKAHLSVAFGVNY